MLITSWSGELGGMEMRMAQEARYLAADGYEVVLAPRRFAGYERWREGIAAEHVQVGELEVPGFFEQWRWRRWNKWRARWSATRRLARLRPDLVHVALCWTTYGLSALWTASRCGLPVVLSVHNAFPPERIADWYRPLLREAFAAVRGVYAVSDSALEHFLAVLGCYLRPDTRLAVIPNPVDVARFRPGAAARQAARAALKLPPDALVLGCVARLSPQKQPLALLSLFRRLRQQGGAAFLVFAGTGPLESELRAQVGRDGLGACVTFTGFHPNIAALMPAFDLHLLLSRNEGFGISTVEAMACGVPALGTDVPGTRDVLRDSQAGLLLPLDDEDAALALVAELIGDPARRARMSRCGPSEASRRYASEVVAAQVSQFYAGLLP